LRQLSLSLDRWPVPLEGGDYDHAAAHRQAFEQRCPGGRIVIELWILELVPGLYIQACGLELGEIRRGTLLRLAPGNRYDSPEAALRAAASRAAREFRAGRARSGLYPESRAVLLKAERWLEDILRQCDYLLERQAKLFE